jgi:ElaB/YqjD/DUF883 family membrane-anchored ribosome-binding protein
MSSRIEESAGGPRTVDEARTAVERSRERISSTLDRLEDRIVDKKHEIQDRADVLRPVRERVMERPLTAVAIAAGVGVLLGSLGGRHDEEEDAPSYRSRGASRPQLRGAYLDDDDRAELRRWRRARRERLRQRLDHTGSEAEPEDGDGSRFDDLKHQLFGALTSAVSAAVTAKIRDFAANGPQRSQDGYARSE